MVINRTLDQILLQEFENSMFCRTISGVLMHVFMCMNDTEHVRPHMTPSRRRIDKLDSVLH